MEFIEKIIGFLQNYEMTAIAGDIVGVLFLTGLFAVVLGYSSMHKANWFSIMVILSALAAVALVATGVLADMTFIFIMLAVIVVASFVLFASEIRRDLFKLSIRQRVQTGKESPALSPEELRPVINKIVKSCQALSKNDTGALMIICNQPISDFVMESGTYLNAELSGELIETVFFPNCPLHDGAMLIMGNKIVSAGCYLPLTQKPNLPKELGTRHRAAIGLTENDPTVTAVVVSEETGIISVVHDGEIKRYMDAQSLTTALEIAYKISSDKEFWSKEYDE